MLHYRWRANQSFEGLTLVAIVNGENIVILPSDVEVNLISSLNH